MKPILPVPKNVAIYILKILALAIIYHLAARVGLGVVSLFSAAISATIGTYTLMLAGQAEPSVFLAIWSTWWIGSLLGALVVTPALVVVKMTKLVCCFLL